MKYVRFGSGFAIFIIFFGLALMDAVWSGNLVAAGIWLAIGLAFLVTDSIRRSRRT